MPMPAACASRCICGGVGEGREADLADVPAGQPVLEQAAYRIAVHRPLVRVAHVEMGVERDQADIARAGRRGAWAAGRVTALLPPRRRVRPCARRPAATAARIGSKPSAGETPVTGTSPRSWTAIAELLPRLDIVGADPPQRPADRLGREVAAARRHRPRLHRRAEQRHLAFRAEQVGNRCPAHLLF